MAVGLEFVPAFSAPFRLAENGQAVVVEQDSPEEIGGCVYNTCVCPQGGKLADPAFGIPWPLFANVRLHLQGIAQAIMRLEPRAQISGTQALSSIEEIMTAVIGQLLPDESLPGRVFPDPGETVQITEDGPGTVNVTLTADVPGDPG